MSITGAVNFSSTDPATRFSRSTYRIANEDAGGSSAVERQGPGVELAIRFEGLQDAEGQWFINYINNGYEIYSGFDYITVNSSGFVISGSENTLWSTLESTDPSRVYIQDPDSRKVWQYESSSSGPVIKLVRQVEGESKQLWGFIKNDA